MERGFMGQIGQRVPDMDDDFVNSVSERYIELYEKITGEKFVRTSLDNIEERIEKNVLQFLTEYKGINSLK
jgi:phosphoribosylaminoimidazole-succinocarboxamide synthase